MLGVRFVAKGFVKYGNLVDCEVNFYIAQPFFRAWLLRCFAEPLCELRESGRIFAGEFSGREWLVCLP
jgi:hypothetical protein